MTPTEAAREALDLHAADPNRSQCRLYDGKDSGMEDRRCWLIPGHQCECMTRDEAEVMAVSPEEARGVVVIAPDHPIAGNNRFLFTMKQISSVWGPDVVIPPVNFARGWEKTKAEVEEAAARLLQPVNLTTWMIHPAGARGNVPPRHRTGPIGARVNATPAKKAARKRQDKARKANRSKK